MKRILIVDDHSVVRDGIKRILSQEAGPIFFGEAASGGKALKFIHGGHWDLVLLDISLGTRNGLEILGEIKRICPKLPILMLTMHPEEQYARRAFKAGASGYITKGSSRRELVKAVKKVMSGGRYVSPRFAEELAADIERPTNGQPHAILSDRELEVMCLIGSGKTVSAIAAQLSLSDRTVSTYRARILEKMKMETNAELIRYVIEKKLAS